MRSHFASFQAVRIRIAASAAPERICGSTDSKFYLVCDGLISLALCLCQKVRAGAAWLDSRALRLHSYPAVVEQAVHETPTTIS
jgi:hypothetical protein